MSYDIEDRVHDELACITGAVAMYDAILSEADERSRADTEALDPEAELRLKMPMLLSCLSPAARGLLIDYWHHIAELVAFVHRLSPH